MTGPSILLKGKWGKKWPKIWKALDSFKHAFRGTQPEIRLRKLIDGEGLKRPQDL